MPALSILDPNNRTFEGFAVAFDQLDKIYTTPMGEDARAYAGYLFQQAIQEKHIPLCEMHDVNKILGENLFCNQGTALIPLIDGSKVLKHGFFVVAQAYDKSTIDRIQSGYFKGLSYGFNKPEFFYELSLVTRPDYTAYTPSREYLEQKYGINLDDPKFSELKLAIEDYERNSRVIE